MARWRGIATVTLTFRMEGIEVEAEDAAVAAILIESEARSATFHDLGDPETTDADCDEVDPIDDEENEENDDDENEDADDEDEE